MATNWATVAPKFVLHTIFIKILIKKSIYDGQVQESLYFYYNVEHLFIHNYLLYDQHSPLKRIPFAFHFLVNLNK